MKITAFAATALAMVLAPGVASAQAPRELGAPPACEGQRFIFEAGEPPHVTRVTLCSIKGATSNDLVRMFDSAVAALSKNMQMPQEKRDDLITQIKSKADALRPKGETATAAASATIPDITIPKSTASATTAIADITLPKRTIPVEPQAEYTSLPPLPPPLPPATATASAGASGRAARRLPSLSKPSLTIECTTVEDLGGAEPCLIIERETEVVVRADEKVPAQTALRFVRRGDTRAEVELAELSRGKSMKFALPEEVCRGVSSSRVEIQVVRRAASNSAGEVVDSMGPYLLHC